MSSYKVIDSTISILYCARCANEHLEIHPSGRIVCADCGMVTTFDPKLIRVGQLKGTKYKMRDTRRYSFREITDEARQDAFKEVYVPSPEPGKGKVGWRSEEKSDEGQIRMAGVDDDPGQGWQNEPVVNILAEEALQKEALLPEVNQKEEKYDPGTNGQSGPAC